MTDEEIQKYLTSPAKPEMRQRKFGAYIQRVVELTDRPVIVLSIEVIEANIGADPD